MNLDAIREKARALAAREKPALEDLRIARAAALSMHEAAAAVIRAFESEAAAGGAPHLRLELSEVQPDAKSIRACQFSVSRGRVMVWVIALPESKFRLVGPFKRGETEGPCAEGGVGDADRDDRIAALIGNLIDQGFALKPPKA